VPQSEVDVLRLGYTSRG